jgi:hypothetical protein
VSSSIEVYVGNLTTPEIVATDTSFASGANGVRVYNTAATFDNVSICHRQAWVRRSARMPTYEPIGVAR